MYWKIKQQVPAGIRYLGEWSEFSLVKFPDKCIIHKQLPGCGFTEFALTCPENVVLCSPRKMLMENKKAQHPNTVYLVINQYEIGTDIDEDVSKPESPLSIESKDKYILEMTNILSQQINNIYTNLYNEIRNYMLAMDQKGLPYKIIVTYDSTYLVKKILTSMEIIDGFHFCVDEMQSILDDSRFKSTTELEFLQVLSDIKNVKYVSATPMLDKYLSKIPELNSIPYFELDWKSLDPVRIKKPDIKVRVTKSILGKMAEIIQSYLDGNFEKAVVNRGGWFEEVESKEAIFFVNSVNHIISIIKKMKLSPDQVNILCSDTPFNQSRIDKKLGKKKGYKIGKVPLRGEPHKMFTFCTRTVYLGADFYSTCARSFIFSDSNSDCLAVDIATDLYQILGRIRLDKNPWKNCAEFYYKSTCDWRKMTQDDFNNKINLKEEKSNSLLSVWNKGDEKEKNTLAETYQKIAKMEKYKDNYIAVNRDKVTGKLYPVHNNLVLINDQRTFDIQQIDYADRFSVFSAISNNHLDSDNESFLYHFFYEYDQLTTYVDKIHMIVDYILDNPKYGEIIIKNLSDSDKIKQQLIILGPERIKGLGYNITQIKKAMGITIFDKGTFVEEIYSNFQIGNKYTKKYIKEKLGKIYKASDYEGTPKAIDLEEWFDISSCKVTIDGKREHCFEIIRRK